MSYCEIIAFKEGSYTESVIESIEWIKSQECNQSSRKDQQFGVQPTSLKGKCNYLD